MDSQRLTTKKETKQLQKQIKELKKLIPFNAGQTPHITNSPSLFAQCNEGLGSGKLHFVLYICIRI